MKRIITISIILLFCADCLAQSPDQVVRNYVSLLNDWLASPYSSEKRKKVMETLNGGESAMKDEIVERFNSDAGVRHTSPGNYLAIFYEKTTASRVKVEIVSIKEVVYDGEKYVVAVLKYSGGISLTTASDFWVSNGKITGIVSNEREIAKLRSNDIEVANNAVSSAIQTNDASTITQPVQQQAVSPESSRLSFNVLGVSFDMVKVQGGTFRMGSDDFDAYEDEKPVHSISVSDYYIGETEVTQGLWNAVMGSNSSFFKKGDNYPVDKLSWDECWEFIKKLNIITGKTFRLPTEAEWEFAARGGCNSKGYKYSGSNNLSDVAWYGCFDKKDNNRSLKKKTTMPVKMKKPNELGLYDMSGNVDEMCGDWYGAYKNSTPTNYRGPVLGAEYVCRGGSWSSDARGCRVTNRQSHAIYIANGFRLVLSIVQPTIDSIDGSILGHDFVDLGLPSGTLWATCNVGAASPEENGDYFAWGETAAKKHFRWANYKLTNKYCIYNEENGFSDGKTKLDSIDDAALQNWGRGWCMPTMTQFKELKTVCTWIWTTRNGINGYEVKGLSGKSIFLPASGLYDQFTTLIRRSESKSGHYWSSSLYIDRKGYCLSFYSTSVYIDDERQRWYGLSVRPVRCGN